MMKGPICMTDNCCDNEQTQVQCEIKQVTPFKKHSFIASMLNSLTFVQISVFTIS